MNNKNLTVALFVAVALAAFCSQMVQAKDWYNRFWYGKSFDHRALYHACIKNHAWYSRVAADWGPWMINQVASDCWKFAKEVNDIHNNTLSEYHRQQFHAPASRVNADPVVWLHNLSQAMGMSEFEFNRMVLAHGNKNKKDGRWTTTGQVNFYRGIAQEMRSYVDNLQDGNHKVNNNEIVIPVSAG